MSDNPLTDILSGVSAYLNEVIDDRLDQRFSTTVLPPAIRAEISRIIDGRINATVAMPEFDARLRALVDASVETALTENMAAMIDKRLRIMRADQDIAIEDAAREACGEAVDAWMDDTSNVNKLARELDLEDVIESTLKSGDFQVNFVR
jgi:phage baseplate assembly protein W